MLNKEIVSLTKKAENFRVHLRKKQLNQILKKKRSNIKSEDNKPS